MIREDVLEQKLQQLWGGIRSINFGSDYFVVKFSNQESYDLALMGGLWRIHNHYAIVQPWKAAFNPKAEVVSSIASWVRIPELPLDYYEKFMGNMGMFLNIVPYLLERYSNAKSQVQMTKYKVGSKERLWQFGEGGGYGGGI
ncbi:hypothetical protein K1719_045145 [Acacia pycnantha]|nr:hypothetical protein K1719_045145 [Acacia pycnantha]